MHDAIDLSGAGTGGTRNISDTNRQHVALEPELADLHGKDAVQGGQERLRITPTPFHSEEHMRHLVDALVSVGTDLGSARA